jgi:hypothetical protein
VRTKDSIDGVDGEMSQLATTITKIAEGSGRINKHRAGRRTQRGRGGRPAPFARRFLRNPPRAPLESRAIGWKLPTDSPPG